MKVWITGARGFVGRHAASACAARGMVVGGLGHGAWPQAAHQRLGISHWMNGDITLANLDNLAASIGAPDLVLHLAGGSAVGPSFAQPMEDFRRSVASATELAEWLRLRSPSTRLAMASSAAVYGAGHEGAISETAPCRPFSPYGYHKRMAELVFESYARSFGLSVALVRYFSVYGPGLRKQLLWDCCTRLSEQPVHLSLGGHGQERRDWLHVADAADLLVRAAHAADASCRVYNGGTGTATTIRHVAEHLCFAWGRVGLPLAFSGQSRPGDPEQLVADTAAARSIGWQPSTAWREGLEEYVRWFVQQAGLASC